MGCPKTSIGLQVSQEFHHQCIVVVLMILDWSIVDLEGSLLEREVAAVLQGLGSRRVNNFLLMALVLLRE
jgi:hypothetical protein